MWTYLPNSLFSADTLALHSVSDLRASLCGPSATSRESTTSNGSSSSGSPTHYWTTHRFGVTRRLSTEGPGLDVWMSSLRDFLASRTQSPDDDEEGLTAATSGLKPGESYLKYDPDTSSWRTPGFSFAFENVRHTLTTSLLTLPASGMTVSGRMFPLPPLVPHTSVGDGGVWPTPTVEGNGNRAEYSSKAGDGLNTAVRRVPTPHAGMGDRGGMAERVGDPKSHQQLQDYVAKFPTPTHADSDRTSEHYGRGNLTLRGAALRLPTPTAQDAANCGAPSQMERNSPPLNALVKMLPMPSLQALSGGKLNPRWVEWLMGTPEGWTSLEPLGMESYLRWLESFSWDETPVASA